MKFEIKIKEPKESKGIWISIALLLYIAILGIFSLVPFWFVISSWFMPVVIWKILYIHIKLLK